MVEMLTIEGLKKQAEEWSKSLEGTDSERLKAIGEMLMAQVMFLYNIDENIILVKDILAKQTSYRKVP